MLSDMPVRTHSIHSRVQEIQTENKYEQNENKSVPEVFYEDQATIFQDTHLAPFLFLQARMRAS